MNLKTDYRKTGVIVARFQVHQLHVEHKNLIDKVKQYHKKVLIFLGVSPVITDKNPLDYSTRFKMILQNYPDVIVLPIQDLENDEEWVKNLDNMIKAIEPTNKVMLYGGRDSFIKYYKPYGSYETTEITSTFDISGTETRESISKEVKDSEDFRIGQIYQLYNRYPILYPTVDAIITRNYFDNSKEYEILLGQKHAEVNTNKWRLIGGFIDKKDGNGKTAIIREIKEETNLDVSNEIINFVSQYVVDDWRYRGTRDGILTTVFHVDLNRTWNDKVVNSMESPSDDIAKLKWFKKSEILNIINPTHLEIIKNFIKK